MYIEAFILKLTLYFFKFAVEQIYNVLSDCQALHPDPQEEAEEEMAGMLRRCCASNNERIFAYICRMHEIL